MLNTLIHWYYNEFQTTKLYHDMMQMAEGSPWHRERSIATHTDMVFSEYVRQCDPNHPKVILGGLATIFHDVGKPGARTEAFKPERGTYYRFHGHEQMSARLWEDYAVQNFAQLKDLFHLEADDIYAVGYMIEMHKPWDIRKRDKLEAMNLTLMRLNCEEIFAIVVHADTWGRISDDAAEKRAKVDDWISEFHNRTYSLMGHPAVTRSSDNPDNLPVLIALIAASGSGKSTFVRRFHNEDNSFSLDAMRHELYGDDYAYAFAQSTKDKHFKATCNNRFRDQLREQKDLVLDNTNTSRKNRRFYLDEAKRRGYWLRAVLIPVGLQTVIDRQKTRDDKTVPAEAVTQQYMGIQLPQIGEFDEVVVFGGNIRL